MPHAREQLLGALQQALYAVAVGDASTTDLRLHQQAFGIDQEVAFSALDLLPAVVSAALLAAHAGRLDALAIADTGAGLGASPEADPHPLA